MNTETGIALSVFTLLFLGLGLLAQNRLYNKALWKHPAVFALGFFGVSGIMFYYGAVEIVGRYGLAGLLGLLAYTVVFIFSPLFLEPLRWISRQQAFPTTPDLLTYRFRTIRAGQAATLVLALASLPIAAAQLHFLSETLQASHLEKEIQPYLMGALAAISIAFIYLFTAPQKARLAVPMVTSTGAILALIALTITGLLALFGVFGSFDNLDQWAQANGQTTIIQRFDKFYALSLIFFTAPFILPQLTYLQALGRWWPRNASSSWMLPLIMLIATLPLFPLLWAGLELKLDVPLQSYLFAIPQALNHPTLQVLVLIAGLFMGVGLITISAMALGKFTLTCFVTPRRKSFADLSLDPWLEKWRTRVAASWVFVALLFALTMESESITDITLAGMIGISQLVPALMATLYLPKVNRYGCLAGLCTGVSIWFIAILLPLFSEHEFIQAPLSGTIAIGAANWPYWLLESLIANMVVMLLVSRLIPTPIDEQYHAHRTMVDSLPIPQRSSMGITSIDQVETRLAGLVGEQVARREVARAVNELNLDSNDHRPLALRMFRDQLSFILSEKIGTFATEKVMNEVMPLGGDGEMPVDDISLLETRLAQQGGAMSGLAAELNKLRLYHRQALENLPIGVCSIDQAGEILLWNHSISTYTGLSSHRMEGANLEDIPQPWGNLLKAFAESNDSSWPTVEISPTKTMHRSRPAWYHLHKSRVEDNSPVYAGNQIILVEDISERLQLIQKLAHSERLTSVGRLAAGVAHEIGNPVTGISCLAQDLEATNDNPEIRDIANMILTQTDRITRIVRTLIDFSRSDDNSDHGPVPLHKTVKDAIQLLSLDKTARQVIFVNETDPEQAVLGDGHQLTQVFVNLLSNARDASAADDTISIDSHTQDGVIHISVTDCGCGIPQEISDRVMDPFFTTKEPGEGTGLGLSLVYSIVRLHGGSIDITSPVDNGRGTRVTITLLTP